MKNLITILILFAVGCGKTENATETEADTKSNVEKLEAENERLEAELKEKQSKLEAEPSLKEARAERIAAAKNKKLKEDLLKLSVVGSYEAKKGGFALKLVFLETGKVETYFDGEKIEEETWKIVGKEVHVAGAFIKRIEKKR